jgi:NAD(P)-dependent dehydrogenase (short-subunit alcohol dehydrogenase family)
MEVQFVTIVTGASRGLGAAVARQLGSAGAAVAMVSRSHDDLHRVAAAVRDSGAAALVLPADISDPDACRRAVEEALRRFGRLDSLVNNAGIVTPLELVGSTDPTRWRRNVEVNLLGPVYMTMAALASLRSSRGRVVNVSSGAATNVIQAASAYCASKAGLNHFTRVLAAEEPEITAIAVRPGVVDTQMQAVLRREGPAKMPADQAAYYQNLKSGNRLEPPEVPARAIAWLALQAPHSWSGSFLSYDEPRVAEPSAHFPLENLRNGMVSDDRAVKRPKKEIR